MCAEYNRVVSVEINPPAVPSFLQYSSPESASNLHVPVRLRNGLVRSKGYLLWFAFKWPELAIWQRRHGCSARRDAHVHGGQREPDPPGRREPIKPEVGVNEAAL